MGSIASQGAAVTNEELSQAIVSFLSEYSIEVTPHDTKRLDEIAEVVPKGTFVYVAHPPGSPIDDIVSLALTMKDRGYAPVPHIISRKVDSRAKLEESLAKLSEHDIRDALILGGDEAVPGAIFDSSLELLETGLLGEYGFERVGVAGHPEGSKAIGEQRVEEALRGKAEFARSAPFQMRLVTQFGFNPEAVIEWEQRTSADGVDLPIHTGLPGPASVRQLARFAMLCGIGTSAKMMMKRTGATANLLKNQAPDDQVAVFARHRAENPASRIVKPHFFAFGGVARTARWANSVAAGRFELDRQGTAFEVPAAG